MAVWLVALAICAYMAGLFWLAWRQDRKTDTAGFKPSPFVYALALSVYCTSWTYFGAVGTAASSGWDYLPIYLGPALIFLFMHQTFRRIGDIAERESVTSLSDFLSARYGKSRGVAALATLVAVAGSLPYIALQLKSVGSSFLALTTTADYTPADSNETVLLTALVLAIFAILFGARQADNTQHNAGLMRILAIEGIVKLLALIAVCALSFMILGRPDLPSAPTTENVFAFEGLSGRFITITLLAMAAAICLPRQFHVGMIERRNAGEVSRARWVFPLYLLATSLVVIPITLAGLSFLPAGSSPDLFVLSLPMQQGWDWLALVVFLGGFSAATGMVIVSTIALSIMVTNDLVVPAIIRSGRFSSMTGDAGKRLLFVRRAVIVAIVLLAWVYYRIGGSSAALAQTGLLSFAAAIQFAPAILGAVYWRSAKRTGVLAGIGVGITIWAYTLFLPSIFGADRIADLVPTMLHPQALLGLGFDDPLSHGVVWSLSLNVIAFMTLSLRTPERLRDRVQAAAFLGERGSLIQAGSAGTLATETVTPNGLRTLAARFLSESAVDHAFADFGAETGLPVSGDEEADWSLIQRTERLLASALGASSAQAVLASAIAGKDVALPDVLAMLDQKTQAQRFERHMLQSMLEHLSNGICVVDHEQKLIAWNASYIELFDYPIDLIQVGRPIGDLIAHNHLNGWIGGDASEQIERRLSHMRAGRPYSYERQRPDGRYLRIVGNPMPGGGFVSTFIDITEDKLRERDLIEAKESLEERVKRRTADLETMAEDRDAARVEAEAANASKTRFLAAASHDLLQPLNAARLFLGAVQDSEGADLDASKDLLAKADKSIQSADELLKGLLDISRLDHSEVTPQLAEFPIAPLLEDLVDEALPMAEAIGLDVRIVPSTLSVQADYDFLTSILRNFISNARRYTREGGLLVGARRRRDKVRVEVWDTGPGIHPDRLSLLFDEFQRFEDADNLGVRGAGLGLSIAQRLANIMDADISVRSWPGKGTVFAISLPLVETQIAKPSYLLPMSEANHRSIASLSVLCVDDEPLILEGMKTLLGLWGCEVETAGSAKQAKVKLAKGEFDAVIADYDLGSGENGLELIADIRRQLPHPENAALLTAHRNIETDGATLIIHKPVDRKEIKSFLERCADKLPAQAAE